MDLHNDSVLSSVYNEMHYNQMKFSQLQPKRCQVNDRGQEKITGFQHVQHILFNEIIQCLKITYDLTTSVYSDVLHSPQLAI